MSVKKQLLATSCWLLALGFWPLAFLISVYPYWSVATIILGDGFALP
jgi:hypothetical protein